MYTGLTNVFSFLCRFRSKRSYTDDAGPERLPWSILAVLCAIAVGATIPNNNILKRIKESRRVDG